ncbi:MAG: hypothetical protein ACO1Q7_04015 [Gemmatimonas sp.]
MARKRILSPEFFTHPGLFDLEQQSGLHIRLAFEALWTVADRRGIFEWKPRELKLKCLPYDDDDFEAVLSALEGAGFIHSYVVNGKKYAQVPSFGRWQTFHKNEKQNDCPDMPLSGEQITQKPAIGGADPSKLGSSPPVSITASVTSTVAASTSLTPIVAEADPLFSQQCRLLTAATNGGLHKRYGAHNKPLHWQASGTYHTVSQWHAGGVCLEFAANVLHERASELRAEKPPRSLSYFVDFVQERWNAEVSRLDAEAYKPDERSPVLDQFTLMAIRYAQEGHEEYIEHCETHHIAWRKSA